MESSKWQGSLEIQVAAPLERVWEIGSDFCGMKRWCPALLVCERVEGTAQQAPGCVRYVSSSSLSSHPSDTISWAKEKLISLDCTNHSYNYAVVETNMAGYEGYQATFQVMENEVGQGTCLVRWHFELPPVAGHSEDEFVGNWTSVLAAMVKTLEEVAAASSSS